MLGKTDSRPARPIVITWLSVCLIAATGCGDFEIIVPSTLAATVVPAHGSVETSRDVEVFVFFSTAVADADDALDDIELRCLGAPPCRQPSASACSVVLPVASQTFIDTPNQTARIAPEQPLQADTCFLVTIQAGIEALDPDTGPFPAEVRSSFRTQP